jgi:DNA-directed RNA polymerase subunit RPC12/RpoP
MAAVCSACTWTGASTQVVDGGRCPECESPVRYQSKPLEAPRKLSLTEFNKSAAKALRAVALDIGDDFLTNVLERIDLGWSLSPAQQAVLMKIVLRHERHIHDRAVVEFATFHAKGYV